MKLSRRTKTAIISVTIGAALAGLSLVNGCARAGTSASGGDNVLPGSPAAPAQYIVEDWFDRGAREGKDAPSTQKQATVNDAEYAHLVRPEARAARRVMVQPGQLLLNGQQHDGFTYTFEDRIQLVVSPVAKAPDPAERLSSEMVQTTEGESQLWAMTVVRGQEAAAQSRAQQKWESGVVNDIPAVIEWTELAESGDFYITYALLGDGPTDQLINVADSLVLQPAK